MKFILVEKQHAFYPAFSFDDRSAKEKAIKKKTLFIVGTAHTRSLLEKRDQNF